MADSCSHSKLYCDALFSIFGADTSVRRAKFLRDGVSHRVTSLSYIRFIGGRIQQRSSRPENGWPDRDDV
jgi:hypothetical protein